MAFEEVKTINWTCDKCKTEEIVHKPYQYWLDRPDGWTIKHVGDPHAMFSYSLDLCIDCSKEVPNA